MFEKHHFKEKQIIEHELEISEGEKTWNFSFTLDKDLRSTITGILLTQSVHNNGTQINN